ncbi:hypothetical protein, conserved [Eimeria tenella]|uniref:Uncharacterized protein n=1 Tax=Eimeria tenella TaxID=5802 RepID=U6KWK2_EIMTE|nr:hypothetical protein, conserved [Eimeria tenella]CDJ40734.1 hypothetical protein, conserved [Eimeria tenella]|eukprot:XP_013231484.1 hypothetical protein, conserved [Eimeria tenella]
MQLQLHLLGALVLHYGASQLPRIWAVGAEISDGLPLREEPPHAAAAVTAGAGASEAATAEEGGPGEKGQPGKPEAPMAEVVKVALKALQGHAPDLLAKLKEIAGNGSCHKQQQSCRMRGGAKRKKSSRSAGTWDSQAQGTPRGDKAKRGAENAGDAQKMTSGERGCQRQRWASGSDCPEAGIAEKSDTVETERWESREEVEGREVGDRLGLMGAESRRSGSASGREKFGRTRVLLPRAAAAGAGWGAGQTGESGEASENVRRRGAEETEENAKPMSRPKAGKGRGPAALASIMTAQQLLTLLGRRAAAASGAAAAPAAEGSAHGDASRAEGVPV